MDTTKIIRLLVLLELALLLLSLFATFRLESYLHPLLQEYLALQELSAPTTQDSIILWVGIPFVLAHIVSVVGLLFVKIWAKYLYLFVIVVEHMLTPFVGPFVEHGLTTAISNLGVLLQGAILAMLFFSSSAFNKSKHADAASCAGV